MKANKLISFALILSATIYLVSCGKDEEKPQTLPTVTTNETIITTTTTAMVSGSIVDNGNAKITEAGFVYSINVAEPTLADNKTPVTNPAELEAELTGLSSGTVYKVRAYAINKMGIAYGEIRSFETGNNAPVASNILITGTQEVNKTVTASYSYSDAEGDDEDITATGTTFQWYVADNASGLNEVMISGATAKTFLITDTQNAKYLSVAVTPKATDGTLTGTQVKSAYTTAVGAETVSFTYNNEPVTYGTIIGHSGKKWLDRNLGASRVAQSIDDYQAAGDLFQWGRPADGHQRVMRTGTGDAGFGGGVTGITSTSEPYATTNQDVPPTDKFIIVASGSRDWRAPQNSSLWQGVSGQNNPCPTGWRIPTMEEWEAEAFASGADAFTKIKLTVTGERSAYNGNLFPGSSSEGRYWSSTSIESDVVAGRFLSKYLSFSTSEIYPDSYTYRAMGSACRCIKNN